MKPAVLDRALQAFIRRRPFRPFCLEFFSGDRVKVTHPEVIERAGELFGLRAANRAYRIFAADSVCQLLEEPTENQ